jgi:hypothetical protein
MGRKRTVKEAKGKDDQESSLRKRKQNERRPSQPQETNRPEGDEAYL